jgi:hypothetical protein
MRETGTFVKSERQMFILKLRLGGNAGTWDRPLAPRRVAQRVAGAVRGSPPKKRLHGMLTGLSSATTSYR